MAPYLLLYKFQFSTEMFIFWWLAYLLHMIKDSYILNSFHEEILKLIVAKLLLGKTILHVLSTFSTQQSSEKNSLWQ